MPEIRRVAQSTVPGMEGRTYSPVGVWVCVLVMVAGSLAGGFAVVFGSPTGFAVSAALVVVGAVIGLAAGIFNDLHGSGQHAGPDAPDQSSPSTIR